MKVQMAGLEQSRYHVAKLNDGRGWLLLEQDGIGSSECTVVATFGEEHHARAALEQVRAEERSAS